MFTSFKFDSNQKEIEHYLMFEPLPHRPLFQAFEDLRPQWQHLQDWPNQAQIDALPTPIGFCVSEQAITNYEHHIAEYRQVPMRPNNWHDWFNLVMWQAWPHSKQSMNQRHIQAITQQPCPQVRGQVRDALTLLDECGIIIASDQKDWLQAIARMQWQTVFIQERKEWARAHCMTIGHALLEQSLSPYIGWCGKALLVYVPPHIFTNWHTRCEARIQLDLAIAAQIQQADIFQNTHLMHPLPMLGIPGMDDRNLKSDFYLNTDYFCSTRKTKSDKFIDLSDWFKGNMTSSITDATSSSRN